MPDLGINLNGWRGWLTESKLSLRSRVQKTWVVKKKQTVYSGVTTLLYPPASYPPAPAVVSKNQKQNLWRGCLSLGLFFWDTTIGPCVTGLGTRTGPCVNSLTVDFISTSSCYCVSSKGEFQGLPGYINPYVFRIPTTDDQFSIKTCDSNQITRPRPGTVSRILRDSLGAPHPPSPVIKLGICHERKKQTKTFDWHLGLCPWAFSFSPRNRTSQTRDWDVRFQIGPLLKKSDFRSDVCAQWWRPIPNRTSPKTSAWERKTVCACVRERERQRQTERDRWRKKR